MCQCANWTLIRGINVAICQLEVNSWCKRGCVKMVVGEGGLKTRGAKFLSPLLFKIT
jgi:hypothetical protein